MSLRIIKLNSKNVPAYLTYHSSLKVIKKTSIPPPYYVSTRILKISPTLINPRSRGYLKLNKTDPSGGKPEIQMNYLTDPRDIEVIIEGMKFARKLGETETVKKWGFTVNKEPEVGCEKLDFESDS